MSEGISGLETSFVNHFGQGIGLDGDDGKELMEILE